MTEKRRIFINIVATYGRSLYGLIIGLFCGRWALMALGEIDYGLYGLVGGLTVFISFLNNVLANANTRFYALSVGSLQVMPNKSAGLEDCRRWFNTALSVHCVVPIVAVLIGYPVCSYAIRYWLTIPPDRIVSCIWVLRYVSLSCFVAMINVPFTAMYRAKQYIAELTIYSFVSATLNVIILYYMVSHSGAWLVLYAASCCILSVVPQIIICIRACIIFPECKIRFSYMWDGAFLKRMCGFSFWQILGSACGLLRNQGMSVVINKFFGAQMNAAQAIGNSVQGQCFSLASAMQGAFVPVITQACGAGDYKKMNDYALRVCKFNIILSYLFVLPLSLEMSTVLKIWLKTPPACAAGLCYCALAYHIADACTVGHMVAVNAVGRIALYQVVLSLVNVFTLPIAITVGLMGGNVYTIMSVVVAMEMLNSAGRVLFARYIAGTSARVWLLDVVLPSLMIGAGCLVGGGIVLILMSASFARVCITTFVCESLFLPLVWFMLLSSEERRFVVDRLRMLRETLRNS